jgi:SAM-dependent methyltransferase
MKDKSMKERFEKIYANNEWGRGSGEGSLPINNRGYITFLENFIKDKSVESVVDLGCGDWQFSKHVKWGAAKYHGYDLVSSVISRNKQLYSGDNVTFNLYSGDFLDLPRADLLIAKDVLQHWSHETILQFLPILSRYKYALLTNCVNPTGETLNSNIADGGFRYLDLRLPPFSLQADEVYQFRQHRNLLKILLRRPQWLKLVLLVDSHTREWRSDG